MADDPKALEKVLADLSARTEAAEKRAADAEMGLKNVKADLEALLGAGKKKEESDGSGDGKTGSAGGSGAAGAKGKAPGERGSCRCLVHFPGIGCTDQARKP